MREQTNPAKPSQQQAMKKTNGQIGKRGSPVSLVSHTGFLISTWVAAIFGGIGITAAFISAIVGYRLTEDSLSEANERISIARVEAKADVEKAAVEANTKIEQARAETAKANERTAELARETEKLRATNLEMEKAFSPRSLTITGADRQKLKALGKVRWVIESVPRDEPQDLLGQIFMLLNSAQWVHFDGPIPTRPTPPAVGLNIYLSDDAAEPAAIALKEVLKKSDIDAQILHIGMWRLKDIAPDGIQISVGRKLSLSMERLGKALSEPVPPPGSPPEVFDAWRDRLRGLSGPADDDK
jgi:hypothetical protein